MRVIINRRSKDASVPRLFTYQCDICGNWHLTQKLR
jgi:hypothetical protein